MTRHSIDDYGHTTQTTPAMITDEWAVAHLPLTQVALAAAVPIIEAEVRERIARDIEAAREEFMRTPGDTFNRSRMREEEAYQSSMALVRAAFDAAAYIAREGRS